MLRVMYWVLSAIVIALVGACVLLFRKQQEVVATIERVRAVVGADAESDIVEEVRTLAAASGEQQRHLEVARRAVAHAPSGIVVVDSEGSIRFANDAASRLLDEATDAAILKTRISNLARRSISTVAPEKVEVDMHDPARVVLALTAYPELESDPVGGPVVVFIEDLSARRRVDAMRSDFVANASHELKTPVGAISLLAEALARTDDEEKRTALAARLTSEANRMSKVVDDILTLARSESVTVAHERVDLSELLDEIAAGLTPLASKNDIVISRGTMTAAEVVGDPVQLTAVFHNLILNAITYTAVKDGEGTVTYRTRIEDGNVCVEVEDTGIGIPAKYLRRIFERFFRVDQARSRESGGTGLGLSIVKNVAASHGGTAYATSEVGVGTTFIVCLPLAPEGST